LLDIFWKNIEPTMLNRQFVDFGTQYRTIIFYHNEEQKRLAGASKAKLEKSERFYKPIVTEILPVPIFYKAEEYHQHYYKKNPIRYEFYEAHSGRSQYLKTIWSSDAKK
jgi:peptide-methionine (S)-S-oxide reductase